MPHRHGRLRTVAFAIAGMSVIPLANGVPFSGSVVSASLGAAHSFGAANASATTTLTATTGTASGSGDLLVAAIKDRDTTVLASVSGITDSAGTNTWAKAAGITQGSQADEEIWYAASAAPVTTVTVTVSGASALSFTVVDLAGATSAPLDVKATAGGSSAAASSGTTPAISQSSEIVVADVGWNGSVTPSGQTVSYTTSTTEQSTASGSASGEQAAWNLASPSGAQSYAATLSASTTWTGAIAAFKVGTSPPPTISSFSPTSGPVGTAVVINGTRFTGATVVKFNTTTQTVLTVNSDIKISTTVPSGATTGLLHVITPGGTANSSTNFTVMSSPPPVISSFSPISGPVGTAVVINGSGFTGASAVVFNLTSQPTFTVNSDIKITTTVPAGATTGLLHVTTGGSTANSSTNFTVMSSPPPVISSFSPISGPVGTAVVINGSGFTGASAVVFNITNQPTFTVNSDIKITTTVPSGATTGPIHVTQTTTATSSTNFTVTSSPPPTISSFSPISGPVGTTVVINGTGFTGATAVVFNTTNQPLFTVNSDIKITTTVPSGATTGPIKVTRTTTATSSTSFTVTSSTPHVLIIVEENQESTSIIGSSNAPYINSLASTYRSATQWYAVQHNSPTDYMELLSGSNQGWPVTARSVAAQTLVDELHTKSIPWKAYMESMPSTPTCTTATDPTGLYEVIHNPFRYFTRYTTNSGGWCSSANQSTEGVLRYPGSSGLVSALTGSNAPDFVWITPNDCHNMHGDSSTGSTCKGVTGGPLIKAGDNWLSSNLSGVLTSNWFKQNGTVIITWDEGTTNKGCCGLSAPGGHIATLVISSTNAGKGAFSGSGDHYGTLRGIEEAYGVTLLGGSTNVANGDLKGAF